VARGAESRRDEILPRSMKAKVAEQEMPVKDNGEGAAFILPTIKGWICFRFKLLRFSLITQCYKLFRNKLPGRTSTCCGHTLPIRKRLVICENDTWEIFDIIHSCVGEGLINNFSYGARHVCQHPKKRNE
jgi:hypothetical protein